MATTAIAAKPTAPSQLALIYDPTREQRYEISGEVLSFPDSSRPAGKESKVESISMDKIVLTYGVNMISSERLDRAKQHEPTKKRLEQLVTIGAVRYFAPDAEVVLGCSTDFTKEQEAIEIVKYVFNKEWLAQSQRCEKRPQVLKAVHARLALVESNYKQKAPAEDMSGFSLI